VRKRENGWEKRGEKGEQSEHGGGGKGEKRGGIWEVGNEGGVRGKEEKEKMRVRNVHERKWEGGGGKERGEGLEKCISQGRGGA